jgi:LacI family transcriptional regulator
MTPLAGPVKRGQASGDATGGRFVKKPTMTDIARACGVSQATVSLVLSQAPGTRVSAATRAAVLARAAELGYRRGPHPERRAVLAMLINETSSSAHVGGLIDGVTEAALEAGFLPLVIPTADDEAAEAEAIGMLAALPVAGVIYARLITQAVRPPAALARWPTVLLNCHAIGDPYPSVVPGDLAAAMAATLHLLDAGHRRVGFVNGDPVVEAARERLRGYRRALASRDLPDDPRLVFRAGWTIEGGREGFGRLRALADPPTAIFCFCDRTAVGVYLAAAEAGLSIPHDLSVVGFDDEPLSQELRPPLSTMELPHAEMARHAVDEARRLMAAPAPAPHPRVKFDCPLVARASVAPPRAARPPSPAVPSLAAAR